MKPYGRALCLFPFHSFLSSIGRSTTQKRGREWKNDGPASVVYLFLSELFVMSSFTHRLTLRTLPSFTWIHGLADNNPKKQSQPMSESNDRWKCPQTQISKERLGDEERRLMHLVPAPAVRLMNRRVLSRPDISLLFGSFLSLRLVWNPRVIHWVNNRCVLWNHFHLSNLPIRETKGIWMKGLRQVLQQQPWNTFDILGKKSRDWICRCLKRCSKGMHAFVLYSFMYFWWLIVMPLPNNVSEITCGQSTIDQKGAIQCVGNLQMHPKETEIEKMINVWMHEGSPSLLSAICLSILLSVSSLSRVNQTRSQGWPMDECSMLPDSINLHWNDINKRLIERLIWVREGEHDGEFSDAWQVIPKETPSMTEIWLTCRPVKLQWTISVTFLERSLWQEDETTANLCLSFLSLLAVEVSLPCDFYRSLKR